MYSAAEDGYERVYIPYTSYTSQDKNDSSFLDIMTTRETKDYDDKDIDTKLSKVLGDKLSLYKSVDYTATKKIIYENIRILFFIIGIFIIVFLIKIITKFIGDVVIFSKEKMKGDYLNGVLKNNRKKFLSFACKIFICLLGIAVIFNLIKFNLVIPPKYLPSDNIFDLDFYKKTIISNIQLNNANENGVSNVYNRYLTIVSNIEKIIFLAQLLILVTINVNYRALNI
ncbi:hypothetical protein [Clostridium akagii]|uniref:hypothetical protein n=1 Tax=Clostridium akagii TaxID=91623 RepID=UPI000AC54E97|nr:hypothetical protein [Clostridium akagii]